MNIINRRVEKINDECMPCMRCNGRKKMYRIGKNGFSLENFGGRQIDCPMCLGAGRIPKLKDALKSKVIKNKPIVIADKDIFTDHLGVQLSDSEKKELQNHTADITPKKVSRLKGSIDAKKEIRARKT